MPRSTKHILIICSEFPPQPGGIGTHALYLAKALTDSGFEVSVLTDQRSDSGVPEADFDKGLSFFVQRIKKRPLRVFMYFDRIVKTFKWLKQADSVVASGKFSLWSVAFCTIFRKRLSLAVIHGTEVNMPSKVLKRLVNLSIKRFDKVVAVSNYTKALMAHLNIPVHVIPNGIVCDDWKVVDKGLDDIKLKGSPVFITVGRVSERKGQREFVEMLPELLPYYPELHYHCVGIADESFAVKQQVETLGLHSQVSFHGVLSENHLKACLKQSDIFIMLSKAEATGDVEGFGIAVLEANAMGIPVIAAKGTGVEDAVASEQSGILIPLGDTKALQMAVQSILGNKETFKKGALAWAEAHDWKHIVNQYIALLS
ncbi:glycosyltransferase family 4 protein [Gaetbulibacter saemankumensis]|uniref:glycosyltransferase family 4 protein n=1 Tax=Gaetbulibacter saemankumensis TaxID=311208 RepID=UPI000557B048|nr:glycosyltransferase family 4 protein [Gaetbulibacter saemankumensis]